MEEAASVELQVFVKAGCGICDRALRLVRDVGDQYPRLVVRVVDVARSPITRDDVFAVPTFVLDGRVLSLGNPQRGRLRIEVEALLEKRGLV